MSNHYEYAARAQGAADAMAATLETINNAVRRGDLGPSRTEHHLDAAISTLDTALCGLRMALDRATKTERMRERGGR